MGRNSQRLQDRIKQHLPKSICCGISSQKLALPIRECKHSTKSTTQTQSLTRDLVIGFHLLRNPTCAQNNDDNMFSIHSKGRLSFHLSALEATFIESSNLIFCGQKEFVYNLKILQVSASLWIATYGFAVTPIDFSTIHARLLRILSLICALHSGDPSWLVSDDKLRKNWILYSKQAL